VISKAIRPDEIRQLSILQDLGEQPETYLERVLDVTFPNRAEVMRVALRGSEPEELKTVVNAIVDAYLEEIRTGINTEKARGLEASRSTSCPMKWGPVIPRTSNRAAKWPWKIGERLHVNAMKS
jgi:hypothetical protein